MLKRISVVLLGMLFVLAGILHFVKSSMYLHIMPPWLPCGLALVYISGACEVLGGIGVLIPTLRKISGFALIALLIAVFPVNIHMALNAPNFASIPVVLLWFRLPLQFALIAWVWWATQDRKSAN